MTPAAGRTERFVAVPGGRLWARADGDGPPVVLLHAGIVDARVWEPFVPLLVADGYRAIRYDARGYGRSETEDVSYSTADDLLAVLDAFEVGRAALAGNSRGGVIAFDLAVTRPERVAAVALLASNISGHQPGGTPFERAAFDRMEALEGAGDLDALVEFELQLWGDGPGQPPGRLPADLRAWLWPMVAAAEDPARVRGEPVPLDPPARERLAAATMPILSIVGGLDLSDNAATARFLAEALPDARVAVVPDAAHLVAAERPELVARLIDELLRPLGRYDRNGAG